MMGGSDSYGLQYLGVLTGGTADEEAPPHPSDLRMGKHPTLLSNVTRFNVLFGSKDEVNVERNVNRIWVRNSHTFFLYLPEQHNP